MAPTLTFVHAADLHLDARFGGVDASDARVRDALVESTFDAFEEICDVCVARGAAFLIIAGDLYNTAERSVRAQTRFRAAAVRLAEARIHIFVAAGNHDPLSGGGPAIAMPSNVTIFSADEVSRECFPSDDAPLAVLYGRSYARSAETRNLAAGFSRDSADPFAIGVLHANVGGQPGFEPYAPCSLEDLRAARMDYWALGHIHKRMRLSENPPVVYPGSPQGLNPGETGGHGCAVVTVEGGGVEIEFVETARVVWERVSVECGDVATADEVIDRLDAACAGVRERAGGRPAIARIDLEGRSAVHALLTKPRVLDDIIEQVRDTHLERGPWVWLDRVRDLTAPAIDLEAVREGAGFAAELIRVADGYLEPARADAVLAEALAPLHRRLDGIDLDFDSRSIVERARNLCLDRVVVREVNE
ncbi:MAG: DNA repair exonuclease [Clostridiales bacterium]|nr:DNA repair exonuclease [Clostridiales bacterium]